VPDSGTNRMDRESKEIWCLNMCLYTHTHTHTSTSDKRGKINKKKHGRGMNGVHRWNARPFRLIFFSPLYSLSPVF
jgi:hypothetical protein